MNFCYSFAKDLAEIEMVWLCLWNGINITCGYLFPGHVADKNFQLSQTATKLLDFQIFEKRGVMRLTVSFVLDNVYRDNRGEKKKK